MRINVQFQVSFWYNDLEVPDNLTNGEMEEVIFDWANHNYDNGFQFEGNADGVQNIKWKKVSE